MTNKEFLTEHGITPDNWIKPGVIPRKGITAVLHKPGVGCTTLFCDIMAKVTRGEQWPHEDWPVRQGSVLYVPQFELSLLFLRQVLAVEPRMECVLFANAADTIDSICAAAKRLADCQLVVIDPWHPGRHNSWLKPLQKLSVDLNLGVVFSCHYREKVTDVVAEQFGSVGWCALMRSILHLTQLGGSIRRLSTLKDNLAPATKSYFTIGTDQQGFPRIKWLEDFPDSHADDTAF